MLMLHPEDLDLSQAVKVISSAQKFILPIPELADAEPLVYPGSNNPITDWEKKPIGNSGVVFFNYKDKAVQGVQGDGTGVIIINEVNEAQAAVLRLKVEDLAGTPEGLNHLQIKEVIDMALSLGLSDMYNSDRGYVQSKMTSVGAGGADGFGLHKRDDRDICRAVRIEGKGEFFGPISTQKFEGDAIIITDNKESRLIQSDIFERTYRNIDGTPVKATDIPLGIRKDRILETPAITTTCAPEIA